MWLGANNRGYTPPAGGGGSAPAWFTAQTDGTWTTRSIGTWPTPIPTPATNLGGENVHSTQDAWTGACVDQRTGELLFPACGGHADYPGNEVYGILVKSSSQQVYRISDPTPNATMGTIGNNPPTNADYGDGRPAATHNSIVTFGDGKVWLPYMTAAVSGQGGNVSQVWSFDRDLVGSSIPWPYASANPWARLGGPGGNDNFHGFGLGWWDESRHVILSTGNGSGSAGYAWWKFSSNSSFVPSSSNPGSPTIFPNWGAYCKELDCVVIGSNWDQKIWVWKLSDDSFTQLATSGTGYYGSATTGGADTGAQYIAANNSIAVCDPRVNNGTLYKLALPITGGAINTGGTAVWSTLSPSGGPSPADFFDTGRNNFTSSRFQVIRDMGNGQAALVYLPNIDASLYVYKVPAAGL
jgi:hypothetical protein